MYITNEAEKQLKALAKRENRNPSQQLQALMDFYEKYNNG